jgi:(1->4)-alpha-D-glucan 1-alpha-D-glucosylmutase
LRIPVATYRLQFGNGFGFREAAALAPYLRKLGISDVYASPIFKAKSGSCSGYDVTDPLHISPELGSEDDFRAFIATLKGNGLGLILDIVPNHMAAHPENEWWMDVLENGACSPRAFYFDIHWDSGSTNGASHATHSSHAAAHEDRVILPVLGSPYGSALENAELKLALETSGFRVWYWDRPLPIDPATYGAIISLRLNGDRGAALDDLSRELVEELMEVVTHLPPRTSTSPDEIEWRYREAAFLKDRLWTLHSSNEVVRDFLDENIRIFNGKKGDPQSFDLLDNLLAQQAYALSYWRVAREKVNYRRFFDISDLVAIRTEDPEVFANTHALVLQLLEQGAVAGVRIDHIDGLNDPHGYLARFREHVPDGYVVVEKILRGDEDLPAEWPVCGTTGYEFARAASSVLVDSKGLEELGAIYARFTKDERDFETVVYEAKKAVIGQMFAGEVLSLSVQLGLLADHDRYGRDLSPEDLRHALVEVTACLPVYRTYVRGFEVGRDGPVMAGAIKEAARRAPAIPESVFEFLQRLLLLQFPASLCQDLRSAWLRFVRRWQQFTGPVMAKGLEDTACYIYNRLVSLNEVGGSPEAGTIAEFHRFNQARQKSWPLSLSPTSTHDTKRSEDMRARIHLLSEIPGAWERRLKRWRTWNARCKSLAGGVPAPAPNDEIFIYQTLLGAWPIDPAEVEEFHERLQAYLLKALREAKTHTSWMAPNEDYESAVSRFASAILAPSKGNRFLKDFLAFQKGIAFHGCLQSLTQTLLRIAAPGVPDTYQGTEVWNLSMVDPDNRRPVDFARIQNMLESLGERTPAVLLQRWQDGAVKLYLVHKALEVRNRNPDVFSGGDYIPLTSSGPREDHVIAFARHAGDSWALAVAPRFLLKLSGGGKPPLGRRVWRDTEVRLPENAPLRWSNVLTGESLTVFEGRTIPLPLILRRFPAALLTASL